MSRDLIGWESQSSTAPIATRTGYQRHEALGSSIMLFARLRTHDRAFWFLGPAIYVKHQSSCRWRSHGVLIIRCPAIYSPNSRRPSHEDSNHGWLRKAYQVGNRVKEQFLLHPDDRLSEIAKTTGRQP